MVFSDNLSFINFASGTDMENFELYEGEFVSILGPSGSGKTTMMNILGCLDVASEGEYILSGKNVAFFLICIIIIYR